MILLWKENDGYLTPIISVLFHVKLEESDIAMGLLETLQNNLWATLDNECCDSMSGSFFPVSQSSFLCPT